LGPKRERRYWYRVNDFNGPGWRSVRGMAESHRKQIYSLFEKEVFDLFPPPGRIFAMSERGNPVKTGRVTAFGSGFNIRELQIGLRAATYAE
jgi:hypothetical protein